MKELFNECDLNKDGVIDKEELRKTIQTFIKDRV